MHIVEVYRASLGSQNALHSNSVCYFKKANDVTTSSTLMYLAPMFQTERCSYAQFKFTFRETKRFK